MKIVMRPLARADIIQLWIGYLHRLQRVLFDGCALHDQPSLGHATGQLNSANEPHARERRADELISHPRIQAPVLANDQVIGEVVLLDLTIKDLISEWPEFLDTVADIGPAPNIVNVSRGPANLFTGIQR